MENWQDPLNLKGLRTNYLKRFQSGKKKSKLKETVFYILKFFETFNLKDRSSGR